jgi:addiction module HigA family antidote
MAMKNPPHVGGLIRREVIEPLGLTVTEAAKVLGVGRQALSSLLNEKAGLTTEMGLRVEKAFGPKMEHLMRMQLAFDLAQARKSEREIRVNRYVAKRDGIVRDGSGKKRAQRLRRMRSRNSAMRSALPCP